MAMMQQQRESRHLWVGNLPDHFDEDDIRAYFEKKFGEVEKVKLLPKKTGQGGGVAAFIDFIELRSAQKAHNCPIVIQNREIRMNYNDPKQGRQTTNQPVQNFQRDFERMPEFDEMPRMKDRQMKNVYRAPQRGFAPEFAPDFEPDLDYRPPRQRSPPPPGPGYVKKQSKRQYSSSPDSNSGGYVMQHNPRQFQAVKEKKQRLVEPIMGSSSGASRRMKVAKHGGHQHSATGGAVSANSSNAAAAYIKMSKKMKHRAPSSSSSEAGRVSESESSDEAESSDARLDSDESISSEKLRGFHAIVVRNLPKRHKDQTIKEGLFFEFKKIGKAACIKIEGSGRQRIAFCYFRSAEECKRIVKEKDQKTFYGKAMEIDPIAQVRQERESQRDRMGIGTQYGGMPPQQGGRYDNAQQMHAPMGGVGPGGENQMAPSVNEFDPKSSRTLFIGNVPREIEETDLYKIFRKYGKILDIDVKRMQYGEVTYAFVQYAHIITCVEAINAEDGRKVGPYRCKTNFAKTTPSACLWASGLPEDVNKINLKRHFSRPHPVTYFIFDQKLGEALLYYSDVNSASEVLGTVKTKKIENGRPYVDFSSREHQEYIMKCMKNKGDGGTRYSCSPSPNRGRGYSSSPLRRDNRRRSPSDSPPRGGSGGGGRGSPGGGAGGGGPGRFSPSRRHGSHSSNRSSRSPSNGGGGNTGGRENAIRVKSTKGSARAWKPSRSRSPSRGSTAIKYKRRPDSHGKSESKIESVSSSKSSKGQTASSSSKKASKRSCVSSEDEHERLPSSNSKPAAEPEKVEPPTEVNTKVENVKMENEKKSTEDLSELQQERERIRQQLLEEDKKSSEPEEGEFRGAAAGNNTVSAANTHPEVAKKEPLKVASIKAEPYEECDIMMSDQSDLESDNIQGKREKSWKSASSGKESEKYSKNSERLWGDVDRGGGKDAFDDTGTSVLQPMQTKTVDNIFSQQHSLDKKNTFASSSSIKGMRDFASMKGAHFLEFEGGDVGEDRPHFQQQVTAAAAALLQNYSPILNASSGNDAMKAALDPKSANLLYKASNLDGLSCAFMEKGSKDEDYICDSPGKQLDNFLSQARAKASEMDEARATNSKTDPTESLHLMASNVSSKRDGRRREEEQHETDDDDDPSDIDDAMRNKMSAMETELQLEDISSPEPFSDTEQQQTVAVGMESNAGRFESHKPQKSSPFPTNRDQEDTTHISSVQTSTPSRNEIWSGIKSMKPKMVSESSTPVAPPTPGVTFETKCAKPLNVYDNATAVQEKVSRKATELLPVPGMTSQKKNSMGSRVIPLDPVQMSPSSDPRLKVEKKQPFSSCLKLLKYARPTPKSPRGDSLQGFTESQSILEDWKRRGLVRLRHQREDDTVTNAPNLQRVNELLNKFNVTSIFDQDSQRLSVLDAEEEKLAKSSPTLSTSFESGGGLYSSELSPSSYIHNKLSIDIPSPTSFLRDVQNDISRKHVKSPISVASSTTSLLKLEDPRLKSSKAPNTPTNSNANMTSTSAPPSGSGMPAALSSDLSGRYDSIRVSDKYQRKPASGSTSFKFGSNNTSSNSGASGNRTIVGSLCAAKEEPDQVAVASLLSPSTSSISSNGSKLDFTYSCRKQNNNDMNDAVSPTVVSSPQNYKLDSVEGKCKSTANVKIENDDSVNIESKATTAMIFVDSNSRDEGAIERSVSKIIRTSLGCSSQDELIEPNVVRIASTSSLTSSSNIGATNSSNVVKIEPSSNEDYSNTFVYSSKQQNDNDTSISREQPSSKASKFNKNSSNNFSVQEISVSPVSVTGAAAIDSSEEGHTSIRTEANEEIGNETSESVHGEDEANFLSKPNDNRKCSSSSRNASLIKNESVNDVIIEKVIPSDTDLIITGKDESGPTAVAVEDSSTVACAVTFPASAVVAAQCDDMTFSSKANETLNVAASESITEEQIETMNSCLEPAQQPGLTTAIKKIGSSLKEKCLEIDIFSKTKVKSSPQSLKNRKRLERSGFTSQVSTFVATGNKRHQIESIGTSKNSVAVVDRGEESSDNEAETKTLNQLMGKSVKANKHSCSASHTESTASKGSSHDIISCDLSSQNSEKKRVLDSLDNVPVKNDKHDNEDVLQGSKTKSKKKRDSTVKSSKKWIVDVDRKHGGGHQVSSKYDEKENPKPNTQFAQELSKDVNNQEALVEVATDQSEIEELQCVKTAKMTCETSDVAELKAESSCLVAHKVMMPLKVEIDSPPKAALTSNLATVLSCSDFIKTPIDDDVSPSSDKCKSAPVSSSDLSSSFTSQIQLRKKRPYVEIVVDESEDQENIDYVQNLHSSNDGIEICIKKVKTELLPVTANEPESTTTNQQNNTTAAAVSYQSSRKHKVSPRKTSVSNLENRRKDDECKSPSRKHSRASKNATCEPKIVEDVVEETTAESDLSDLSAALPSETESSQDGSIVSQEEDEVVMEVDSQSDSRPPIVVALTNCKESKSDALTKDQSSPQRKYSTGDNEALSNLTQEKTFFASFTDETDCEDSDNMATAQSPPLVGKRLEGSCSSISVLKHEEMRCGAEDVNTSKIIGETTEDLHVTMVTESHIDEDQNMDTETSDGEKLIDSNVGNAASNSSQDQLLSININGERFTRLESTSPVYSSKADSACRIAESILGVIETNLTAPLSEQTMNPEKLNSSSYSNYYRLEVAGNDIQKSFSDLPVGEQKIYEYLAGLSTTSTFASSLSNAEVSAGQNEESEPQKIVGYQQNIQQIDISEKETENGIAMMEMEDESCENVEPTPNLSLKIGEEKIVADPFEYCIGAEEENMPRTPSKARRRGGRYRKGRMSRPYNRKGAANRHSSKSKLEVVIAPAENSSNSQLTNFKVKYEATSPPNFTLFNKTPRVPQVNADADPAVDTRTVHQESSMTCVIENSDFKSEATSFREAAEPLQRKFSDISCWSGNSGPTSPVSATMPPKERLKKQLKAFFAEQTNANMSVAADNTLCKSPATALPFNRTNSAGSLENEMTQPKTLRQQQPEKCLSATAYSIPPPIQPAPVHNPNPPRVSTLAESPPTIFTFNELPPPATNTTPFLQISRHPQVLSTPAPQHLRVATGSSSLMPIKSEPKQQYSQLSSKMQELKEKTQELSLEREKRRSELKQLTSLSEAEIDNVEACIESVLQDNSILVKRFRCTADIEANFIDDEVRESAELLQSYVEDVRNFRYFGKQRKKNATEISNLSSSGSLSTCPHVFSNTSSSGRSPNSAAATSPVSMISRIAAAPTHYTSDYPTNSIQSSIERVILQHSEQPKKTTVNLEESLKAAAVMSQHLNKNYSLNTSGDDLLQDLNLANRTAGKNAVSLDNSNPTTTAAPHAHNAYPPAPKSLIGLPLPFESTSSMLQNPQNTAALAAAAAAVAASNSSPLLQGNESGAAAAFRLDHSNPQLLAAAAGATGTPVPVGASSSAISSSAGTAPLQSAGVGGGGGDMHININLLAHYPAYHPELLSTLYGGAGQATPTRLVTLQIPSPLDTTGIEAQMFIARTSNLYTTFNKLAPIWEGIVELKNSQARMSLRFIRGNMNLAMRALDSTLLNINQRMTLEETELEGLSHNLQNENDYCVMLGLPNGPDPTQICTSNRVLEMEIAKYLREKDAAGIINFNHIYMERETQSVLHIFPPCEFTKKFLLKLDLYYRLNSANCSYLMFILTSAEVAATSNT